MEIQEVKDKCEKDYNRVTTFLESKRYHRHIPLFFTVQPNSRFLGWYSHATGHITTNLSFVTGISNMIAHYSHEKAHAICDDYGLNLSNNGQNHHLEFAIIYYSIKNAICGYDKETFLCSYDIQDDDCYKKFNVNMKKFDDRIKSIKFNTIEELVQYAIEYAEETREKCKTKRIREYVYEQGILKRKERFHEETEDEKLFN